MIYTALTNRAMDIAYEYHDGQKDKAGRPYFVHVLHVAEQMDTEYAVCVALLHDTLEDTELGAEVLESEFPPEVVEAVKLLTHDKSTDYFEYVREVAQNPIARKVKQADLRHNLDLSRFDGCSERMIASARKRSEKYREALRILQD